MSKSQYLSFRATDDEASKARAMARVLGCSVGEVMRLLVKSANVESAPRVSATVASASAAEVRDGERR